MPNATRAPASRRLNPGLLLVSLAIGIDVALICGDVLLRAGSLADERWSLARERGFGELWQYAKTGAISAVLLDAAVRLRSRVRFLWALLFFYVLADDVWQWHERAGLSLGGALSLPAVGALRPNHLGEMLFLGGIGLAWGAALLAASWWARRDEIAFSRSLLAWLAALATFGVLLDAAHSLLRRTALNGVLAIVEDGGEMMVLSLLVAHLWRQRGSPPGGGVASTRDVL